ncbi:NAD(P)-dependent dehydrogenase (short-subunit alcohol dehydrogenase family) [Mycobacterium frederiksbergense]|uniref:NAD(P)-dependent dehydrogenase (Short-subunit alcohol dehydrogenase family) n=1 Tax=Mycolicibacterium frederiksbergense TaxID=117567 RepID=A0ABT6L531_9MYCO|nr:SDR family oxidoreductase [Mycolicibacterium frederiksbergense]MDH6197090.1 NAD(P)-dependent dehydrogenase (short-subunit alcohol dehydrogenase family) [Mycolicibacterium frederiksbergense]
MSETARRIVVVGAGSGIGAATAAHFFERGDHVLAVDLRPNNTPASQHATCDLRDPSDIARLLSEIGDDWDTLAHVAGVPGTAPAADVLKVNYLGMRLMTEGMLPLLRRGGSVVAVASTAALGGEQRVDILDGLLELTDGDAVAQWQAGQDQDFPVYTTSKQAAILFIKRVAGSAWSKYGVRINTVSPGPVQTPILSDFEQTMGKDTLDLVRATVGRHATVDDVVPLIAFLTSPESRWINGQDIQVDAGFIAGITNGTPISL